MVSFRGQKTPGPRTDWSALGVSFKISDEVTRYKDVSKRVMKWPAYDR